MTTQIATDTELSAINSILGSIGQSPITQIEFTNPEISFIYNIFEEVTKDVQNEGWHFNKEDHVEVSPDSNGNFIVPTNYLRFDVHDGLYDRTRDVAIRNGKLYDKVEHTDVFTDKLYLDITYLFSFTDVPPVIQRYIIAKASVRAATQLVSNPELVKLLQTQEAQTRTSALEYDCEQGDHSFFGLPDGSSYRSYQPYKAIIR